VSEPGERRVGRALAEAGTFLSLSTLNYWRKYAAFIEDWQFELSWRDQRRKFFTGEGLRLDSNNMRLNWTHAGSGAIYYNWARSNRLGAGESFLFAAGGSLVWEYISEWREIASINDHIFTTAGGLAIGEPMFQIGSYFRARGGLGHRLGAWLTNPFVALNDTLDGSRRAPRVPLDEDHDFRFALGGLNGALTADDRRPAQSAFTLDMRVVTLPGFGAPGAGRGYTRRTLESGLHVDIQSAAGALEEFTIRTRSTLFGWWWKHVVQDERGRSHGYDLWLGAATAWDMFQKKPIVAYDGRDLGMTGKTFPREQPTRYADKFSSAHFPGPAFSLTRRDGRLRTRLDLQATVDFSMVNSLAFNPYSASHDTSGVKTTLHNWGYYYALGTTAAARLEVQYGPVLASAGLEHRRFGSIEGLDRYQADVTDDGHLVDSRLACGLGLTVQFPRTPVFSSVGVERTDRYGRFHEVTARRRETRFSYQVGVRF
jgi:hypothetical protein